MPQVSNPNEQFLQKEYVLGEIFRIMEPQLYFMDFLPQVQSTARSVWYKKETTSAASDTKKALPRLLTASAQYPKVQISQLTIDAGVLNQKGFSIEIDRDAITQPEGIDEINRALERVGYWLAESVNTQIAAQFLAEGTALAGTFTPTAVWSAATATPVTDLVNFRAAMRREGYPYRLTDVFVNNTNLVELQQYLVSIDISDNKQRAIYGMPADDAIEVPAAGCTVHGLLSSLDEGTILGVDKNHTPATLYYFIDGEFSQKTVVYENSDGKIIKVPNFGLSYNQFMDQKTHNTVVQLWMDYGVMFKEPYATINDTGI